MHDRICKGFLHNKPDLMQMHGGGSVPRLRETRQHVFRLPGAPDVDFTSGSLFIIDPMC
jgi:hypothetical protein